MIAVEGIARLQAYFASAPTRQGILARRVLGNTSADDSQLAKDLVRRLTAEIRADGSVGGAFVSTAWAIVELHDLGGDPAAATRPSEWLLARQDAPGRFGEGCTPPRHAGRTCEHFMRGFFAVATPTERVATITLPTGKVIRSEGTARFAASCLALRAVILAGQESQSGVRKHVESLAAAAMGPLPSDLYPMEFVVAALSTLAHARQDEKATSAYRDLLLKRQKEDGTWSGLDSFTTLEALMAEGSEKAMGAVRRAVPSLLASQRRDGTFGALARQERALIGLEAMVIST
ncbi:MAG TPA: hypothetical protein VFU03_08010 [Gemmatimonadales bacterium]|nr:hypothetical protein [Gemmatimonadales bacterium]